MSTAIGFWQNNAKKPLTKSDCAIIISKSDWGFPLGRLEESLFLV